MPMTKDWWSNSRQIRYFQHQLSDWFIHHARILPFRKAKDPYSIWVSEIMLQQTTMTSMLPYYERFMTRFPSPKILAIASEEDVLSHWQGLGYYSRARNLHKACQQLVKSGRKQHKLGKSCRELANTHPPPWLLFASMILVLSWMATLCEWSLASPLIQKI